MSRAVSVGLVLAGLAVGLVAAPAAAQKPRAERPTYALGDRWIRTDGAFDLVRIEKDLYVFAADGGREVHLSRDLGLARVSGPGRVEWETLPALPLRWPLEVGKWEASELHWRTELLPGIPAGAHPGWTDPRTVGMVQRFTWKVEAYEDVETPAGRLKAFRVDVVVSTTVEAPMRSPSWAFTLWYAPEARQWVKLAGEGELAPLGFEVAALPDRLEPLRLVVGEPADGARSRADRVEVSATATAGRGVGRVTVSLNGREVAARGDPRAPRPEVALRVPVTLREGRNVLLVTATDAAGQTRQEARTLHREAAVAVVPPASPGPAAPAPGAAGPAPPPPPAGPTPAPAAAPAPLRIAIASPADRARVEQDSVALAAVVSGGAGVQRVLVALNGVEIARQEPRAPERSVALSLPLALRDGANTVVVTATEADGSIHQEARSIDYARPVPLAVTVRFPPDGLRVGQASSVVAAEAGSSKGLADVRVSVNGVEVHRQSERTPPRTLTLSVPVKLQPGVNAIIVAATEPDGTVRQVVRTVTYEPPPVAAAAPAGPPPPRPQDRWAVVIGVGQYDHAAVPRLHYAAADAEAVYQVLIGPGGFKREHVVLLSDRTERKPTLRNIRWALGTFLSRSARKDDTVVIFFAGHGAPEVDPRGVERDGLAKYLAPSDADPDDLYSTALPMDELLNVFARVESERVVAFLDACYSGAAGGRTFSSQRTRAVNVDDAFLERLTRARGRAIVTAARPAEVSLELSELGHGLFSYYLVEGLKGAADGNRDGIVTLQELYEYLDREVAQKSRAVGGNQHPVMKGEMEGVLPLVKVRAR